MTRAETVMTAVLVLGLVAGVARPAAAQAGQSDDGAPGLGGAGVEDGRTPIRTVQASETQPVRIWTRVRTVTAIVLPEGESVVETASGDAENWDVTPAGTVLYVKPLLVGMVSNLTVRSATGRVFTFTVVEDGNAVTDYVVTVEAREDAFSPDLEDAALALVPTAYRAAGLVDGHEDRMAAFEADRRTVIASSARDVAAVWERAEARREAYRRDFALRVRLPYRLTVEAFDVPFQVRDMWTDGRFTYLRSEGQELPALFSYRGGERELVEVDVEPEGLLVADQVLRHGILSLGGREAYFGLASEGGWMPQERPGWWRRQFGEPPRMFWTWGAVLGGFALLVR